VRLAVVGASTGLGRCIGIELAKRGADVALLARNHDLLVDAAKEAGPGTLAIRCDVTDVESCKAAVEETVGGLGGLDGVVFSTGMGWLSRVEDITPEKWHEVFGTNVVGANNFTAAALPHLEASKGAIAYFTSVSASLTAPWPGLGAYIVTKAALDKLIEVWRMEHPQVGFTRVIVGDCGGGEGHGVSHFASNWDQDLAGELFPIWLEKGMLTGSIMEVEELINAVEAVLRVGSSATIPTIAVTPRPPVADEP